MLAYNCSPSFNWKKNLDDATIAKFQRELGAMGYKFQFITLAGFHSLNYSMFNLAYGYARNQMSAFVELQEAEFAAAEKGFTAVKHQREVGTGYFDAVTTTIEREASTAALKGSTEDEQFFDGKKGKIPTAKAHAWSIPASPSLRRQCTGHHHRQGRRWVGAHSPLHRPPAGVCGQRTVSQRPGHDWPGDRKRVFL
jgi:hypothetical protein